MSPEILGDSCQAIVQTRTRDEFRQGVIKFANGLGFDYVSTMTVIDHSLTHTEFINVGNTPAGYGEGTFGDRAVARRDPVMQHCKRGAVPIVWDQATYLTEGLGDLWEEQAAFGYRTGIASALHLPEGRHFVLGVQRPQDLPAAVTNLTRLVADLQLFAVYAQDAALRIFLPAGQSEMPTLTRREAEVLSWTMEGKTAWEAGVILGISERTAVLHIQNAMRKLGAVNKHQAVLKALRLGLIH